MQLNTVIFDMDGLLIDSEPLWEEAAMEVFKFHGADLTVEQCRMTTGLRTKEFVDWWFRFFQIDTQESENVENQVIERVMDKVSKKAKIMPGVEYIFNFFVKKNFKIGIASSSPRQLIDLVIKITGIAPFLQATASAEHLPYGKPHPQVYLNCAEALRSDPTSCICFEDSFHGMIAAKAARMKCVVVPHVDQLKDERWGSADLKLSSLQNFGDLHFQLI